MDYRKLINKTRHWRVNQEIRTDKLRVLDPEGKVLGVMTRDEALNEAQRRGLDIVEIAPKANPPVAKIIELGKFIYTEEKRAREQNKKSKVMELKEVRFSPFIAQGDYDTRIRKIDDYLEHKHKVRVVVVFKGRHMESRARGYELLREVTNSLKHNVNIDMEPKFLGRHLGMVISPLKKKPETSTIPNSVSGHEQTKNQEIGS